MSPHPRRQRAFRRILSEIPTVSCVFVFVLSLGMSVATVSESQAEELLVDPGFEMGLIQPLFPISYGIWGGDEAASVGETGGVVPVEGDRMLQFVYTGTDVPGPQVSGDLSQLVDIEAYRAQIENGEAVAVCSGHFNRVQLDEETDRLFRLSLRAYVGEPWEFREIFQNYTLQVSVGLVSDGDPSSWERVETEMTIPPGTDFIAVLLEAREDVANDTDQTEFDGHFADDFRLRIEAATPSVEETWGRIKALYR